ncbi:MAG: DUF2497 domain-containing protein [Sphingomicrobium sp.]
MQSPGREPSMEDILASIKKVIAEEKELRTAAPGAGDPAMTVQGDEDEDVLELDHPVAPPAETGPSLLDDQVAGETRKTFEALTSVAAAVPPAPSANPLEEMIRDMLKPILKQWVDEHLPQIVNEQVRREISRITGRKL